MSLLSMSKHYDHVHPKYGVEQVGWLGQTGAVYALEDHRLSTAEQAVQHEPGSFTPLYIERGEECGHVLAEEIPSDLEDAASLADEAAAVARANEDEHHATVAAAARAEMLQVLVSFPGHVVEIRDTEFAVKHPFSCRPDLHGCPVNDLLYQMSEPPCAPGYYEAEVVDDALVIGRAVPPTYDPLLGHLYQTYPGLIEAVSHPRLSGE